MSEQALRLRLSQLDTDALIAMWKGQERDGWAEDILRAELLDRGLSPESLEHAAQDRGALADAAPNVVETWFWYGFVARLGTLVGAAMVGDIVTGLLGGRLGVIAAMAVIAGYVAILVRRLLAHREHASSAGASIVLVLQWIEAGILALVVVGVTLLTLLPGFK